MEACDSQRPGAECLKSLWLELCAQEPGCSALSCVELFQGVNGMFSTAGAGLRIAVGCLTDNFSA